MTEREVSAITAAVVSVGSALLSVIYIALYMVAKRYESPTRFGRAIRRKYIAMSILFGIFCLLNYYTTYFNLHGEVGIFTFSVRFILRSSASVAIAVAVVSCIIMIVEYIKAGRE